MQHLLPKSRWEADGIRDDLQGCVAERLGTDEGVLIIDETGFATRGTTSAGVRPTVLRHRRPHRELPDQRLRRLHRSPRGHALVNPELYLPEPGPTTPNAAAQPAFPKTARSRPRTSWPAPWSCARKPAPCPSPG
ncbi:transposase [Streptomyces sp. NPDC001770]